MVKILIIDDDMEMCQLLQRCLIKESYEVDIIHNGADGLQKSLEQEYHLLILDIMLPGIDGLSILRDFRRQKNTPILMLTAKDGELDKVVGLAEGADDYLTKPFSLSEFCARVNALIRRFTKLGSQPAVDSPLIYGVLQIDPKKVQVIRDKEELSLTAKEYELLLFLASHPGQVFTKKQIYQQVWGDMYAYDDNNIMVHIRRLRKKIEVTPEKPVYIQTVWGIGYRFNGGTECT